MTALRRCVQRGCPLGEESWCDQMVQPLGLESTLGPQGRPKKRKNGSCHLFHAQVIPSPWDDLRQGLVLGGESLWNRARELLDQAGGHEEIRWRRRADGDEVSRLIASLVAQEADRRVAIWLRVRVGGQRMTELAKEYGYRDGSGVHRVVHRLEEAAKEDRDLAHRLQQLADRVSSVKS